MLTSESSYFDLTRRNRHTSIFLMKNRGVRRNPRSICTGRRPSCLSSLSCRSLQGGPPCKPQGYHVKRGLKVSRPGHGREDVEIANIFQLVPNIAVERRRVHVRFSGFFWVLDWLPFGRSLGRRAEITKRACLTILEPGLIRDLGPDGRWMTERFLATPRRW